MPPPARRLKGPGRPVEGIDVLPHLLRAAVPAGVAVLGLLLGAGTPAAALPPAADSGSVAGARAEASRLRAQLADLSSRTAEAIVRLEEAEHALGLSVGRAARLGAELEAAQAAAGGSDRQLTRRVSALYRAGGSLGVYASLLQARDPADFAARKANVDKVVATDARLRAVAVDGAGRVAALEAEAREAAAEQVRATAVAEGEAAEITRLLDEQARAVEQADVRVRALVEQERRAAAARELARLAAAQAAARAAAGQTTLRAGVGSDPSGSRDVYVGPPGACHVGAVHSFTDTWLAPRSGGRQHQGTDVFAPYGAPAYAVVDGTVERWGSGGLGGISLWLRGDDGARYYYAHNVSNVAAPGSRVRAGQLVAYVGTTGNAATTPPHIHFEAHPPGGGGARNPYPWLRALCG